MPERRKSKATRNVHMIEFGGAKNVLIKKCRFLGSKYHWKNNEACIRTSYLPK